MRDQIDAVRPAAVAELAELAEQIEAGAPAPEPWSDQT
jgi:hypothetical protein